MDHLHGVISRRELLAAGVGPGAIAHRLKTGRLFLIHPGVYAVGRRDIDVWGLRRAAVLACGDGATLSGRSAAAAWGLRPSGGRREVTLAGTARLRPSPEIRTRRRRLADDERTLLRGIPITTPMRTLVDLAALIPRTYLRRAVERATELELFDLVELQRCIDRHPRRPGLRDLRALLADFARHGMTRTRSDLEALFLQLCLDHDLPRPTVNRSDDGREADFTWPGSDLIVEVDSWRHHRQRKAFALDRAKDREALRAGRRTARYTGDEVEPRPAETAAEVRALLGAARGSGEGGIRTLGGP